MNLGSFPVRSLSLSLQLDRMQSVSSIVSCRAPPPPLCLHHFPFKTQIPNLLFPTTAAITTTRPSLLLAPTTSPAQRPRKLLCRPPSGKYVREDYLVKKLSAKEVQELVKGERNVPLVIDFYATWCGPCILMAQELEMLAVEYKGKALIVKVNTDDEYEFAHEMQVRGLPTVYFISPDANKDAIRTEGLIPLQMMRDILNNEM